MTNREHGDAGKSRSCLTLLNDFDCLCEYPKTGVPELITRRSSWTVDLPTQVNPSFVEFPPNTNDV